MAWEKKEKTPVSQIGHKTEEHITKSLFIGQGALEFYLLIIVYMGQSCDAVLEISQTGTEPTNFLSFKI